MTCQSKSRDKIIKQEINDKHFESDCHKLYNQFTIKRYIVENPNYNKFSGIIKKYVDIHNKKCSFFHFICVKKVDDNHYIRQRPLTNLDFRGETDKIRCNFPQILERRIIFASCYRFMTFNFCIKQPMLLCEIKLNQILHKNPKLINCFNRFITYPFFNEDMHIPYSKYHLSQNCTITPI